MFGLAIDLGYSNLKMKFGLIDKEPKSLLTPVGAGPISGLSRDSFDEDDLEEGVVFMDGEMWVSCVEPKRIGYNRSMNPRYYKSAQFKAIFKGALLRCNVKTVDILTIGLPMLQYKDQSFRDELKEELTGAHKIGPKLTVEVKHVNIQPQAGGAFLSLVDKSSDDEKLMSVIEHGTVLICDPGYFSFDWILMDEKRFKFRSSDSDAHAMSMLLESASDLILHDHNRRPKPEKLEALLRAGKTVIHLNGEEVDLIPFLDKASVRVADQAIEKLISSIRYDHGLSGTDGIPDVDVVAVVGGGSRFFVPRLKNVFSRSTFVDMEKPEMANVDGFWISTVIEGQALKMAS